jgi:hypothetical protein
MDRILLCEMAFGSHLYGTSTPQSDFDYKGLYLPSAADILLGTGPDTIHEATTPHDQRNKPGDVDRERIALKRFVWDIMNGQTWALDFLFGSVVAQWSVLTPWGHEALKTLVANRDHLVTRSVQSYVGYARKQAARYGIKGSRMDACRRIVEWLETLPPKDRLVEHAVALAAVVEETKAWDSLELTPLITVLPPEGLMPPKGTTVSHLQVVGRKVPMTATVQHALGCYRGIYAQYGQRAQTASVAGGVDFKALSHAVRVYREAVELLTTGWITFPRPDRTELVAIKLGQVPATTVYAMIEEGLAEVLRCYETSSLPEVPDRAWADAWLVEQYARAVRAGLAVQA